MPIRVAVILVGMACAALHAQAQSEEKAVVAVVQRMFDAMASRDSAAAQSVLIAEGRYFSVRENGAQVAVGGTAHKEFAERLAGSSQRFNELLDYRLESLERPLLGPARRRDDGVQLAFAGRLRHLGLSTFSGWAPTARQNDSMAATRSATSAAFIPWTFSSLNSAVPLTEGS